MRATMGLYMDKDKVVKVEIDIGIQGKEGLLNLRDEWAKGTIVIDGRPVKYTITRSMMSPHLFIELEDKRPVIVHLGTVLQAVANLGKDLEWTDEDRREVKKVKEVKKP